MSTALEVLGRYRLTEHVGGGGFGDVYRASADLGDVEKEVAVKVLRSSLSADARAMAMFDKEARLSLALSHANVVQTFEVGRHGRRWFLVMEYVDGIDLGALIRLFRDGFGQPVPHPHALLITREALRGLDYAHRCTDAEGRCLGLVHRDVSPANILLSRSGEVKLADFGIARTTQVSTYSQAGVLKGKVPYMAPEHLLGARIDQRTDVYAMGCVLFEMVTGRRMFSGTSNAIIPEVIAGRFPRPREIDPQISAALESVILTALELDPEHRWATAAAMGEALHQLIWDEGHHLSSLDLGAFVARSIHLGARAAQPFARPVDNQATPTARPEWRSSPCKPDSHSLSCSL